ncbi:MAG: hypothetical protein LBD02_02845 [Christensenellaceae bacterium]|jgi:hypothetical protein|nr:hypothetical protein [Christensenellaceae bacterium]
MKRINSAILAVLLCVSALLALNACGSQTQPQEDAGNESSIAGTTWALVQAEQDGVEVDFAELMGGDVTYEFKDGGVVTNSAAGNSVDGTYTESGNTIPLPLEAAPSILLRTEIP